MAKALKDKTIVVRMEADLVAALKSASEAEGMPYGMYVRRLLAKEFGTQKAPAAHSTI